MSSVEQNWNAFWTHQKKKRISVENGEKLPKNANNEEESGRKSRAASTNKTKILWIHIVDSVNQWAIFTVHFCALHTRSWLLMYNGNWLFQLQIFKLCAFFLFLSFAMLSCIVQNHSSTEIPINFFYSIFFEICHFNYYIIYRLNWLTGFLLINTIWTLVRCSMFDVFGHCNKWVKSSCWTK